MKYIVIIFILILNIPLCCTCTNNNHFFIPDGFDEPPGISSFSTFPPAIQSGETVILSAFFRRAQPARIEPGFGIINLDENSFPVTPQQTTTYTLSVSNPLGTVSRDENVTVDGQAQPENITVTKGETADFAVTAVGSSIAYQW